MTDQMGDLTSLYAVYVVCGVFIVILLIGCWVEDQIKKKKPPRKGELVKFYTREMCKAAHALSNDDLEDQAQNLIKHIDQEWKLKRAGDNDACTW